MTDGNKNRVTTNPVSTVSEALVELIAGRDLSASVIERLFGQIMDGELSVAQKSALLVALAVKGESVDEIAGAARAMRGRFVAIPHQVENVIDTCGTGGDGKGTFNVSTAAALVAAGAGVPVAKHGNRSISSRSGSADVLEKLGAPLELSPEDSARCLTEVGLTFLFAPRHHPAMKEVMPVRRELGVRTLFNVLGPLTNPAGARRQLMGVYSEALVEPIGRVLLSLGSEHALVVHGQGLDEITTTGSTTVCEVKDGEVSIYRLTPEQFGFEVQDEAALAGGDPAENASLLSALLDGEGGPLRDITCLNAGAAIYVAGVAPTIEQGIEAARAAIESGAARSVLVRLQDFTS